MATLSTKARLSDISTMMKRNKKIEGMMNMFLVPWITVTWIKVFGSFEIKIGVCVYDSLKWQFDSCSLIENLVVSLCFCLFFGSNLCSISFGFQHKCVGSNMQRMCSTNYMWKLKFVHSNFDVIKLFWIPSFCSLCNFSSLNQSIW